MFYNCKKDGVILTVKRVSDKVFKCGVLFSDSIFVYAFIYDRNCSFKITIGHQVFGFLYVLDGRNIFKVESLDFFLGMFFWTSQKFLMSLLKLINVFLSKVPENLKILNLYSEFIHHTKLIHDLNENVDISFNEWLSKAIN